MVKELSQAASPPNLKLGPRFEAEAIYHNDPLLHCHAALPSTVLLPNNHSYRARGEYPPTVALHDWEEIEKEKRSVICIDG